MNSLIRKLRHGAIIFFLLVSAIEDIVKDGKLQKNPSNIISTISGQDKKLLYTLSDKGNASITVFYFILIDC